MYTREELSKMTNLSVGPHLCATINKIVDNNKHITAKELLDLRAHLTVNNLAFIDFVLYEAVSLASELDIVEEERKAANERAASLHQNMIVTKFKIYDEVYFAYKTNGFITIGKGHIEEIHITNTNNVTYRCSGCFALLSGDYIFESKEKLLEYIAKKDSILQNENLIEKDI